MARGALALVLLAAVAALGPAAPAAVAEAEVVVARGHFVAHGPQDVQGTVEVVRLATGGHEVRFAADFRFRFVQPPLLQPLGEPPLTFDVRALSAGDPTNADAFLAQTPVPALLGRPDAVLGPLQARQGAQAYALPAGADAAALGSVVLHCADFQEIMGHATLHPVG